MKTNKQTLKKTTNLASVRFEHSVCRESLMATCIYIYIYIYITLTV